MGIKKKIFIAFLILMLSGCDMDRQSRSQTFTFEDFETAEEAQAKLIELFPVDTGIDEVKSLFKSMQADCYPSQDHPESELFCHYQEKTNILTGNVVAKVWITQIQYKENKVQLIKVEQDLVGL